LFTSFPDAAVDAPLFSGGPLQIATRTERHEQEESVDERPVAAHLRRHDLDPLSLVFGLLFTAGGLALLSGDPAGGTLTLSWAGPVAAISVALLVVLAALPRRGKAVRQPPVNVED
jgi:hypothetical protein